MEASKLRFKTIDLALNADTAVAFRRDSYMCSFGSDQAFGNADDYVAWLKGRIASQPAGQVHVWDGTTIIGQMEMLIQQTTPVRGYVNLFYLVPEARGQGIGATLHAYFLEFMRGGGACLARLSVSPSNVQASAYYRKQGWSDLGPRRDDGTVHLMEIHLAAL